MKQKILTFIVCLLAGITVIHAQTESESSIVSFIKTADDWKVLESMSMSVSDNTVVYTLKGGSQVTTDVTHGQKAELPVYNAICCVSGTLSAALVAEYCKSGQLIIFGTANNDDLGKISKIDSSVKSSITSADFSHLDMSAVTHLSGFFYSFSALKRVDFCGGKIHSNVTNLSQMLNGCSELEEVDFSGCDFSGVNNKYNLLANCPNLNTIKAIGCNDATISLLREIMNTNRYSNVQIITSDQQEAGSTETTEQD